MNPYTTPNFSMVCKRCAFPVIWANGKGWVSPKDGAHADSRSCAASGLSHQPVDERDYALAAERIWKVVRTLDPNRAERAELEAACVPKHTIDALLGGGFAAFASGLIALLPAGSLDHLAKHKRFDDSGFFVAELTQAQKQQFHGNWERWGASETQWELIDHIDSILPLGKKANLSRQCSTYLWEACWYMAHAAEIEPSPKRAQWLVQFIEYLLPDLTKRVNAHHRTVKSRQLAEV